MSKENRNCPVETAPRVSLIVTTCNRPDLLRRAVQSAFTQTYRDFEILIVDDASDGVATKATVDSLIAAAPAAVKSCISYIRHEDRLGLPSARNTGIAHATGRYVTFLDDDDECVPNRLEDQVKILDSRPDIGMVYGWIEEVNDQTGMVRPTPHVYHRFEGRDAYHAALTGIGSKAFLHYPMIRKSIIAQVGGFNETLRMGEEVFFTAMITRTCDAMSVEKVIARCHINHAHERLSQNPDPSAYRHFWDTYTAEFQSDFDIDPDIIPELRANHATMLMRTSQVKSGLGTAVGMIRGFPLSARNLKYGGRVVHAWLWYATPFGRIRGFARNLRSMMYGIRNKKCE